MMTPTRKSGRQPKLSARLKDFLYENDMDKIKESSPRGGAEKKKTEVKKEPVSQSAEKKKVPPAKKGSETKPIKAGPTKAGPPPAKKEPAKSSAVKKVLQEPKGSGEKKTVESKKSAQTVKSVKKESSEVKKSAQVVKAVKKEPEVRVGEKRKISEVTQESPDSSAPSRKSKRTPKPSAKFEEFVYEDEKGVEATPVKKDPKSAEKAKRNLLREEEKSDKLSSPSKIHLEPRVTLSRLSTPESDSDILISPRARVANLTSISVKKGKMSASGSQLTVKKGKLGKVMSKSPLSSVRVKHIKTGKGEAKSVSAITNKKVFVASNSATMKRVNLPNKSVKPKGESDMTAKTGKNIKIKNELTRPLGKGNKIINKKNTNAKEIKKVEKKEIEKVLQVNKEVMTQLLNFGAEVAEAMACNNESIFSFSTKDNPLQTFRIDKQDDFSDEEVVKIIKWFEEEEEQRRAYRKRILEALRASHETNMSLYTQMLKMLQSVTAS